MNDEKPVAEAAVPPPGVKVTAGEGWLRMVVRAGRIEAAMMAAFIIAVIWTAKWALDIVRLMTALFNGVAENPAPEFVVASVMTAAGLYCALLCLWSMIGHDRLVIRDGKLFLGNPWLCGITTRHFDLDRVGPFECAGKDCGVQAEKESSCCTWSAVDYSLTFACGDRRVPVFIHLPQGAKDWVRDRLNEFLRARTENRSQG